MFVFVPSSEAKDFHSLSLRDHFELVFILDDLPDTILKVPRLLWADVGGSASDCMTGKILSIDVYLTRIPHHISISF